MGPEMALLLTEARKEYLAEVAAILERGSFSSCFPTTAP